MARSTFVLWYRSSCKDYWFFPAPHDVSCERRSVLDDVLCERCAAPHDASPDGFAVLDPVAYRTSLERSVLERFTASEPQHLTLLAWWPAPQLPTQRLVREVKTRLDARLIFHSCWRPPRNLPRNNYERLLKMNTH